MDYKTFRNILDRYYFLLKDRERINCELDVLWYDLTGVKAIRYDKEHLSYNPSLEAEYKDFLRNQIADKEVELDFINSSIALIELKLSKMSELDRDICLKVIADKTPLETIGNEIGYSNASVWRHIKRTIEKI